MNRARDDILGRIRARAVGAGTASETRDEASPLPPAFVRNAPNLTELFLQKLKMTMASSARIERRADLPSHVAALLKERSLPLRLALAQEPALVALDWTGSGIDASADLDPLVPGTVLSGAVAGIAETGSLVFTTAGASRPIHNLLAELQIVVLSADNIVPDLEAGWRAATAKGLARGVVLVTGPSRTGDIEMSLELGAHGAVAMHLVLIAEG